MAKKGMTQKEREFWTTRIVARVHAALHREQKKVEPTREELLRLAADEYFKENEDIGAAMHRLWQTTISLREQQKEANDVYFAVAADLQMDTKDWSVRNVKPASTSNRKPDDNLLDFLRYYGTGHGNPYSEVYTAIQKAATKLEEGHPVLQKLDTIKEAGDRATEALYLATLPEHLGELWGLLITELGEELSEMETRAMEMAGEP